MKKDYKSILGLNTVKAFIVVMLSLAIIAVVTLIVLGNMTSEPIVAVGGLPQTLAITNESFWSNNSATSGGYLNCTQYNSGSCGTITVSNATGARIINSGNYTQSSCNVVNTTAEYATGGAQVWKVSYLCNYKDRTAITGIPSNVSVAIISFFGNATTFFALLGVVVIILIISLVVVVVNRFGGDSTGGSQANPSL